MFEAEGNTVFKESEALFERLRSSIHLNSS